MRLEELDTRTALKIVLPAFIIVLGLIYLFLRSIVQKFLDAKRLSQTSDQAARLRGQPPHATPVVRKTDIFTKLNGKQKKLHAAAEQLYLQKKYREAAQVFEHIGFQRRAVDILEQNGLIDEAAFVLLRMKLPHRAAVILERNGQFEKAIDCYARDNKPEMIAKVYEKMAWKDYRYYQQAADFYLKAGLIDPALLSLAKIMKNQDVLSLAFAHQKYDFLWNYLQNPFAAANLLPQLSGPQIETIIGPIPLTPQCTHSLGSWLLAYPHPQVLHPILVKVGAHKDLTRELWSLLSPQAIESLLPFIASLVPHLTPALVQMHRETLAELGKEMASRAFAGQIVQIAL